jgi:lactate 2-monooxygenase
MWSGCGVSQGCRCSKGLQRADDAGQAAERATGVWISNHGGRNLDIARPTLDVLPSVVARVDGRVPLSWTAGYAGARMCFKAIALGATAVAVGRPYVWRFAVGGREGVRDVVRALRRETELAMALTEVACLADRTPDRLVPHLSV